MITRTGQSCQMQIHSKQSRDPIAGDDNHAVIASSKQAQQGNSNAGGLPRWQKILRESPISVEQLISRLGLSQNDFAAADTPLQLQQACKQFNVRAPEPYIARIKHGDVNDPLLRQILPTADELEITPGYSSDPLDEASHNPVPGLIHKYKNRVLLLLTRACAIHCRYCFRRHFPYENNTLSRSECKRALTYIAKSGNLDEVIFSGGDPLAANDKQLQWLSHELAAIPRLLRLRIHSRLPVVLPQRVNDSLLEWLGDWPRQKIVVIHCNHPQELDDQVATALAKLSNAGVTLLNQSVLLKGVNDDVQTLASLSNRLFDMGVMPYYLHQLDRVQGAAHFRVSDARARRLAGSLSHQLPGYLVPKLVQEQAGAGAKTPLSPIF